MSKNTTQKLFIGLIVASLIATFTLPGALAADTALQQVRVADIQAIEIRNQTAIAHVIGWNFSGAPGTIDDTPINNLGETQNITIIDTPVATLFNNNMVGAPNLSMHINRTAWNPANIVNAQAFNVTARGTAANALVNWPEIVTQYRVTELAPQTAANFWVNANLHGAGAAESTMILTSELA